MRDRRAQEKWKKRVVSEATEQGQEKERERIVAKMREQGIDEATIRKLVE